MTQRQGQSDTPLCGGVSIIAPVYNSEGTLEELVSRVEATFDANGNDFEIILVNDGSRDRSWDVLRKLARTHPRVKTINLMRNYGQHNAILCGIREARYEVAVTLDDDLQHPPEEIPKLLGKLDQGFDVVYGTPEHEQHGFWRDSASQITKLALQSAMGAETARKVSAFRAFRTELREAFATYQGSFICIDVLLTWATARFAGIPVRHDPRKIGASNYTFWKLCTVGLNMVTGFSTLPLQIASIVGFAFTVFGAGILAFVLFKYFTTGTKVAGFAFLASTIAIFAGAQLFALGIIGEYIARLFSTSIGRPAYAISTRSACEDNERPQEDAQA